MSKAKFITFEGGEGTGKTSQIKRLAEALQRSNIPVIQTREPGGAPSAEEIRSLLVSGAVDRWQPMTEVLLHYAARVEHLEQTVKPALESGKWVLSDRFADSTMAYQGYGHGIEITTLKNLHQNILGSFQPDLTLMLDIPVEIGLGRARGREQGSEGIGEDRYERMELSFHQKLRDGFFTIAKGNPSRCKVIDAGGDMETVSSRILTVVNQKFELALT